MQDYSFGDSELAALRLAHVALAFEASSRAFLTEWGPAGCGLAVDLGCGPASSGVRRHGVDSRDAATMFSLNLEQFRHNEDMRQSMPEHELDALAAELAALREDGGPPIEWGLRQLVIEA